MPKFAAFMMLFAMANAGLPATSRLRRRVHGDPGGGQGELLARRSLAATTLILGAAYTLWMYKRVIFGAVANDHVAALTDLNRREFWLLGALAAAVLCDGHLARSPSPT